MSKIEEFKEGLTPVSLLAIVYAAVVMTPVLMYMYLLTGLPNAARFIPVFVSLLLFTEVGRFVGRYITTQEAYIIYFMTEIVAFDALYWMGLIQAVYYQKAPYTELFGIASKIPWWAAPNINSYAVQFRTLFAWDWVIPIFVTLIGTTGGVLIDIGLSFIFAQLFIELENLPFPIAPIDAQAISTLTERTANKMVVFSFAAIISFVYEIVLYGLPRLTEALIGVTIQFIPYPWVDLTESFASVLPGALIGIATDISSFAVGWVIPWDSVIWLLIGSVGFYIVGNTLAIQLADITKIPMFLKWKADWSPVAKIDWLWQRSIYDLWASPQIGLSIGVGLFSFIISAKYIRSAINSLSHMTAITREKGYINLKWVLLMIIVGSAMGIMVDIWLYPQLWFVWIFLWTVMPFLQGILLGRSYGEVGLGVQIPYVREAFLISFTPPGDVYPWMVPAKVSTAAGIITHRLKVAMLTKTKPIDYFKAYALTLPLVLLLSFIYLQVFWSIAPMPSAFYPWTAITWPIMSLNFSLWVSRSIEIFKPELILGVAAIVLSVSLLARKFKIPFSPIGFAAGAAVVPPFAFNYFLGALVGKLIIRKYGKEAWEQNRSVIIAGLFCGIGLALALSVAIAIVTRSIWTTPY
ncbi:MAG: OPT/YSL family transporter [Thermoproteales archaeon]|nr:OPT/YSL family transporter [Thermoproteales archaeon]